MAGYPRCSMLGPGLKGSYILAIRLEAGLRLTVGRLGNCDFPAGLYLYFGSALNGLAGRVGRHLRREKKLRWHVDYLTAAAGVGQVWWAGDETRRECSWAQAALQQGASVSVPGFGSSDCRCSAHLLYLGDWASARRLVHRLMADLPPEVSRGAFAPQAEKAPSAGLGERSRQRGVIQPPRRR